MDFTETQIMSLFAGFKLGRAIALGVEILGDLEQLVAGVGTTFSFSWQGRTFTVNIGEGPPAPPPPPVPPSRP